MIASLARLLSKILPLASPAHRYLPYAVAFLCVAVILAFGDKFWDANDDEHMAMIAQGYGLAGAASPGIVYSNVVWGWLAMRLGTPFGIPGYTVAAYAAMLASAAAIAWVMVRKQVPGVLAAALLLAMFIHPLLEPQFSVTAGYASLAGVALVMVCDGPPRWSVAAFGCLFLVLGALIRFQECLFVGLVSAPFLGYALYRSRGTPALHPMLAALLAALAIAGGCKLLDSQYYSGTDWNRFRDMNALRKPLTDYGLGGYFLQQPDRLRAAGLSRNDMMLVSNWFFLDDQVYNRQTLGTLIGELPLGERLAFNLGRYDALPRPFTTPLVALLSLTALLALVVSGRRRVAAAGIMLFALSMFLFLLMGRPGVPRIFPGAVAALALMMLLDQVHGKRLWAALAGIALLCGVCVEGGQFFLAHRAQGALAGSIKQGICDLPDRDQLQVVWGAPHGFADRYVFDPTQSPQWDCLPRIYLVGVLELLPANLQQLHDYTGGMDLIPALLGGQRFFFLTTDNRLDLLDRYMHEHYGVGLHSEASFTRGGARQYRVWVDGAGRPTP